MRLLKRLRGERGYTLVELITVMLIMSIVMTGITTVFVQGGNAELSMNSRFQAQSNARLGLDKIRKDIHCANAVDSVAYTASWVTLFDPCVAFSTVATQGALSGLLTGTFTVASTVGFPTTSAKYLIDSEIVTGTLSGNTITITARGVNSTVAVAHAVGVGITPGSVNWCTATVGGNIGLYRQTGSSSCSSASPSIRQVDRLTSTSVFAAPPYSSLTPPHSREMVLVNLSVNTGTSKPYRTANTYRLCDGLVLRNSTRLSAAAGTYPACP